MNRLAKDGAMSSLHYGGEGVLTHPSYQADRRASGCVRDHGSATVHSTMLAFKVPPVSSLPSGLRATGSHRGTRARDRGAMSPRVPACATRRASLWFGPGAPRRLGGLFSARLGRLRARLHGFPPALDHPMPHRVREPSVTPSSAGGSPRSSGGCQVGSRSDATPGSTRRR